jgi:hypothetical protein
MSLKINSTIHQSSLAVAQDHSRVETSAKAYQTVDVENRDEVEAVHILYYVHPLKHNLYQAYPLEHIVEETDQDKHLGLVAHKMEHQCSFQDKLLHPLLGDTVAKHPLTEHNNHPAAPHIDDHNPSEDNSLLSVVAHNDDHRDNNRHHADFYLSSFSSDSFFSSYPSDSYPQHIPLAAKPKHNPRRSLAHIFVAS